MKTQSALPWYGSDASIAKDLAQLLDTCKHVTIPFAGGLGILPHLKARAILANDKHDEAITFYKVLKVDMARERLISLCQETLCHPTELRVGIEKAASTDLVFRAWSYWARCWLGMKGKGGTPAVGKTASIRRNANGGTNASRLHAAAMDLDEWADLFHKVEFVCQDFSDVLNKGTDNETCGYYVDPPWVKEGKAYLHPFTETDHRTLAAMLASFEKSPVVVRYGDDPLIRELYPEPKWTWIDAESRTQGNSIRGEVWIVRNVA